MDQEGSSEARKKTSEHHRQPKAQVRFFSRACMGCYRLKNSTTQTQSSQTEVVNRTDS